MEYGQAQNQESPHPLIHISSEKCIIEQLNQLTPAELIILEEHLKLGKTHLKNLLNDKEFDTLIESEDLSLEQFDNIQSNRTEIFGNTSLLLNTIFTATFGAWLGYSSFLG